MATILGYILIPIVAAITFFVGLYIGNVKFLTKKQRGKGKT